MKLGILGGTKLATCLGNKYLSRGVDVCFGVREDSIISAWIVPNQI